MNSYLYTSDNPDAKRLNALPFCKIARIEHGIRYIYSCEIVRAKKDEMLQEFREKNISAEVEKACGVDRRFEEFKKEIEDFLAQCKCRNSNPQEYAMPQSDPNIERRSDGRSIDCPWKMRDS